MRKLVAIMFADMTGFTAMMQEDEAKAKILRNRQQQTLEI
jgi:class 3 adenylate cyclase